MTEGKVALHTREGIDVFVQHELETIRTMFNESGAWSMVATIFGSVDPRTGEEWPEVGIIPILCPTLPPGEDPKNQFVGFVRDVVKRSRACGVSLSCEAWVLMGPVPEINAVVASGKSIANHRSRTEAILYTMEHLALPAPRTMTALITRDAAGTPTLGPWKAGWGEGFGKVTGRFFDLLDRTRFA